ITLLVAGDGDERERVERRARELALPADRVRFLGFRRDVPRLLAASDFFVLPSRTEGLPLCLLEAMAQGLPAIATPVGGVPEVIEEGITGLLTPVEDPAALAEAIRRLAAEPALRARMGAAAQRRAAEEFSFAEMTGR